MNQSRADKDGAVSPRHRNIRRRQLRETRLHGVLQAPVIAVRILQLRVRILVVQRGKDLLRVKNAVRRIRCQNSIRQARMVWEQSG